MVETKNRFYKVHTTDYFEIGKKACSQAARIRKAIEERGIKLVTYTPTNQIFIDITKEQYEKLSTEFQIQLITELTDTLFNVF